MTDFAQLLVAPVLNSLPEGVFLALGAWLLLRLIGSQNSRTRFAVWLTALAGVVALPVLSSLGLPGFGSGGLDAYGHPEFTVPDSWAMAFLIFWAVVGSLALARVVAGVWQVRRLRSTCREAALAALDLPLQEVLHSTRRPVRLLISDTALVPAAIGFWRPAIVLPAWALDELAPAELRPILIHELEHLRRHDDWTNLLQKTARAVLFFHPAVWWIDSRLSVERELACDDAVLAVTGNPRAYAGCLIDLLERGCARRGWTMAQALVARARDASMRIARILQAGKPATLRMGRAALGVTAVLSMACAGVAIWAPSLVGFAPDTTSLSASLPESSTIPDLRSPTAPVVSAMFHPESHAATLRRATVSHRRASARHRSDARNLMARRQDRPPVVLARLNTDAKPAIDPATSDEADRAAAAPAFLLFAQPDPDGESSAQPGVRSAAAPVAGRRAPVMQIQMVQIIEEQGSGRQVQNVQILRLVLIVPVRGETAQSI